MRSNWWNDITVFSSSLKQNDSEICLFLIRWHIFWFLLPNETAQPAYFFSEKADKSCRFLPWYDDCFTCNKSPPSLPLSCSSLCSMLRVFFDPIYVISQSPPQSHVCQSYLDQTYIKRMAHPACYRVRMCFMTVKAWMGSKWTFNDKEKRVFTVSHFSAI